MNRPARAELSGSQALGAAGRRSDPTPQSRCLAAVARADITPPVGIYHRMWGAATHDRAAGVHRPIQAAALYLQPLAPSTQSPRVVLSVDHCILEGDELSRLRRAAATAVQLDESCILLSTTHTHGVGLVTASRSHLPGGDLIAPYLDTLADALARIVRQAREQLAPSTILYATGHCSLARHRDFYDVEAECFACGFNPEGFADQTLVAARFVNDEGLTLATIVNYACHPTTLAWENTLLSPDWIGAMREAVEQEEGGICVFLQGAAGDLGPREGFVGDPGVADRNGRQVAHAALSALCELPQPGTEFRYAGPVTSGATLGAWRHAPLSPALRAAQTAWSWETWSIDLPYRHDLPTESEAEAQAEFWRAEEAQARHSGDETKRRDCRAEIEQRVRLLERLRTLPPGRAYPLSVTTGVLGDAVWVCLPGEPYQHLQAELRARFAPRPVLIATTTNGWLPGYLPPAKVYGYGIYQELIALVAPGCLETLTQAIIRRIAQQLSDLGLT